MKTKLFSLFSIFFIILLYIMFSCTDGQEVIKSRKSFDFASLAVDEEVPSYIFSNPDETIGLTRSEANLGIVKFTIASKRLDCRGGWGICDVKWFPWRYHPNYSFDPSSVYGYLYVDASSNYYVSLQLSNNYSFSNTPRYLIVEEDIIGSPMDGFEEEMDITIVQGSYQFDSSLGTNGGYTLNVEL